MDDLPAAHCETKRLQFNCRRLSTHLLRALRMTLTSSSSSTSSLSMSMRPSCGRSPSESEC